MGFQRYDFFCLGKGAFAVLIMRSVCLSKVPDATAKRKIAFCNAYMGLLDYFKVTDNGISPPTGFRVRAR